MATSITPIPVTGIRGAYANLRIYHPVTIKPGDPPKEILIPEVTPGTIIVQLLTLKGNLNGDSPRLPSGPGANITIWNGNVVSNKNIGLPEPAIEGEGIPKTYKATVQERGTTWKIKILNTATQRENELFPDGITYNILIVYPSTYPIKIKNIPLSFWQRAFDNFWNNYKPIESIKFEYNHDPVADQYSIGELLYATTRFTFAYFNVPLEIMQNQDIQSLKKYYKEFMDLEVMDKFGDPYPFGEDEFTAIINNIGTDYPSDGQIQEIKANLRHRSLYRLLANTITSNVLKPRFSNKAIITVNEEIAKLNFLNARSEAVKTQVLKITDGNFGWTRVGVRVSLLLKIHDINLTNFKFSVSDNGNIPVFSFSTQIESEGPPELTVGLKTDGGYFDLLPIVAIADAATDKIFTVDIKNISLRPEIGIRLVKPEFDNFERIDKEFSVDISTRLDFSYPPVNIGYLVSSDTLIKKALNGISLQDFLDEKLRSVLDNFLRKINITKRLKYYLLGDDYPITGFKIVDKVMQITYVGNQEDETFGSIAQPVPYKPSVKNNLSKIDHIIVLMMENRSFDQMLGYLKVKEGRNDIDGLTGNEFNMHIDGLSHENRKYTVFHSDKTDIHDDPCHAFSCMKQQIGDSMNGFVDNWALKFTENIAPESFYESNPEKLYERFRNVMRYYGKSELPTNDFIANEYAVCDKWFCSHPGQTQPNRFISYTGKLNKSPRGEVEADNPDFGKFNPVETLTIFDYLTKCNVSWKIFEHGYSLIRLFSKYTYDTTNVVDFNSPLQGFHASLNNLGGTNKTSFPSVAFIEPDYIDVPPGADDHPPSDVKNGQKFIARVIRELQLSGIWEKSALIITYDESGGFYDHVMPPNNAIPLMPGVTRYGPRVPSFVISPFVPPKTVSKDLYDHVSILATIVRRFINPVMHDRIDLGPRLKSANDIGSVLSLDKPRQNVKRISIPPYLASVPPNYKMMLPAANSNDFHDSLFGYRLILGYPPK